MCVKCHPTSLMGWLCMYHRLNGEKGFCMMTWETWVLYLPLLIYFSIFYIYFIFYINKKPPGLFFFFRIALAILGLLCFFTQLCLNCNPMDCSPPGSSPWDSPGKNTRVDCHSLLQGIFLTQGLNLGLLHCRQFLCHLRHRGRSGRGLL